MEDNLPIKMDILRTIRSRRDKTFQAAMLSLKKEFWPDGMRMAEIGVFKGVNFRRMWKLQPDLLVGIDLWADNGIRSQNDQRASSDTLQEYYANLLKMKDEHYPRIRLLRMSSQRALAHIGSMSLHYIYIDADHTYDAVLRDLRGYMDKLIPGGILAGHDYVDRSAGGVRYGVIEAVRDFMNENMLEDIHITPGDVHASYFIPIPW